ncbi:type II toxin-antitoxin system YoeB family toxin [Cyclobacterium sp. SYSU L10401]|uniref:type II toxin-antitoxin system YoeB family toxin n=1 Tax=Cyclobacterium sp. SYSU L10401 TaxID=2678657 RepID=UPI0013D57755|nr:type II toxin-antitoxin system YoeB family toxin [Cyclobacterium sp. SYSU L10401]
MKTVKQFLLNLDEQGNYRGYWSRRINREYRLVYAVSGTKGRDQKCTIIQCRFHY